MHFDQEKSTRFSILIKILSSLGGLLFGLIICRMFFFPFTISDNSMEPHLNKEEIIIALKHISPQKDQVVIIESPVENDKLLVKRIIAIEGDTIEIRDKIIYINGNKFRPAWRVKTDDTRIFPMEFTFRDNMPAVKLDRDEYFVLGDNFDYSFDSRNFGPIHGDRIIGRIIYIFK